ncbi:MAG: extracellular solute-binding protein [Clostridia bacterium]|nr:extracellular solute-binding protein [Clostridia bacterium]
MKKGTRMISLGVASVATLVAMSGCGGTPLNGGGGGAGGTDKLYISARDSGLGYNWLEALAEDFTAETGIETVVAPERNNTGDGLSNNYPSSPYAISFCEAMEYTVLARNNFLYDISDIVKAELADGTGTIESKLYDDYKDYLQAYDGNYYSLPWSATFNGITYDAEVLKNKYLYFADANGEKPAKLATSSYTGKAYTGRGFISSSNTKLSPGPDGKYDTYDDGLPSSYEEFFYMCDQMIEKGVIPFIYAGAADHYLNYVFQALLLANTGAKEMSYHFSFDSKGETTDIITGFNSDGTPIIKQKAISNENGYEIKQQAGMYYALKFLYRMFTANGYFFDGCETKGFTGKQAFTQFIESKYKNNSVAMLIEGSYWYGEAAQERQDSVDDHGPAAKNRQFKFMTLPSQEFGTVNENQGTAAGLADCLSYYIVVNANIKNDEKRQEEVAEFLKFIYRDSSLQKYTTMAQMPAAVKYDLPKDQYDTMETYGKSTWDIYESAMNANNWSGSVSSNLIFLSNPVKFKFGTGYQFFHSTLDGKSVGLPKTAFVEKGKTAREYFEGMAISKETWDSQYKL